MHNAQKIILSRSEKKSLYVKTNLFSREVGEKKRIKKKKLGRQNKLILSRSRKKINK
jgi:hypothetical protein